jgi:hypothetical protein
MILLVSKQVKRHTVPRYVCFEASHGLVVVGMEP